MKSLRFPYSGIELCVFGFLGVNFFEGALRWILAMKNLSLLIYSRDVFLLLGAGLGTWALIRRKEQRRLRSLGIAASILLLWTAIGFAVSANISQSLFGLKLFFPLLAGIAIGPEFVTERRNLPVFFALWLLAVFGLILSSLTELPWVGFNYNVGSVEVEGQRQWALDGADRLAGFSRASFEAGTQIGLLGILLAHRLPSYVVRVFVVLLTALGLYLTTARTAILAAALAFFVLVFIANFSGRLRLLLTPLPLLSPLILFLGCCYPSLTSYVVSLGKGGIASSSSFVERAETVWLDGFDLLAKSSSLLTGRGIGGIGAAQKMFDPNLYNPADNFALYLLVTFGVVGATALYVYLVYRWTKLLQAPGADYTTCSVISAFCFGVGLFLNGVESNILSFFMGATLLSVILPGAPRGRVRLKPPLLVFRKDGTNERAVPVGRSGQPPTIHQPSNSGQSVPNTAGIRSMKSP